MATNLPSRAWFFAGVAMLCTIRIGVMAFRPLGRHATRKRTLSATAGSQSSSAPPDLANLREHYVSTGIERATLPSEPHILMAKWVEEACRCKEVIEPNAMCLATVGEGGKPSARFVLMKGYDERGVTWYTNYNSRKSQELKAFPHAAITFWWGALHRSVRFEGEVAMVSEEESDTYFSCRPTGSKIGAWVSDQSEPIASREKMTLKAKEVEDAFASEGDNIPRPPHWGGFRLKPSRVEFWEGQPSRLHDRFVYSLASDDADGAGGEDAKAMPWTITRLQP
ncbi:unnamed protein product [Ectocarpus sp. CCAP 1310/34]|nr:unnamed protein product [Ectocarpus sp. CCAP 1310/34]